MKDQELVELWAGNPNTLFNTLAENEWEEERWKQLWGKHRLLPTKVRKHIEQEVNNDT